MAIELRQQLKLTQQLIMTPQLQMAIKLLQLSRLELVDTIQQELEENPTLEEVQETPERSKETEPEEPPAAAEEEAREVTIDEKINDEIDWSNYIDESIDLFGDDSDVIFASHHWPTWGRENVVAYLETLLQDNGYDTVSAGDGREGMEKARSEKPDLITLDISMPEESGVRFFRELKEDPDLSGIPVIIMSGYEDEETTTEGLSPENSSFLHKPFRISHLSQEVNRLVGSSKRSTV